MELTREQIAQKYSEKKYDYVSCPESLASHVYTRGWLDCMEYLNLTVEEEKKFLTMEEVFPEFTEEDEIKTCDECKYVIYDECALCGLGEIVSPPVELVAGCPNWIQKRDYIVDKKVLVKVRASDEPTKIIEEE
jgi:hypothetical protein